MYTKPEVLEVSIDKVARDPFQPRFYFSEEEHNALKADMKARGQRDPVKVHPKNDDGMYILRGGERRLRALKDIGRETIFIIVIECSKEDDHIEALADNTGQVRYTPYELFTGIQKELARGRTVREISIRLCMKEQTVKKYETIALGLSKSCWKFLEHDNKEKCIRVGEVLELVKRVPDRSLQNPIVGTMLNAKRHTRKATFTHLLDIADPAGAAKPKRQRDKTDERRMMFSFLRAMHKGNDFLTETSKPMLQLFINEMSEPERAKYRKEVETCIKRLTILNEMMSNVVALAN